MIGRTCALHAVLSWVQSKAGKARVDMTQGTAFLVMPFGCKVSFVTLWDGRRGDGPGGTEHLVELARKLTGRQPVLIDPATL